mmetsp:Transcript_71301/g.195392  ORF Transcript_71301/g.195392 Transcript_71301/m.195392 type:complete len:265 (-) Transcript_71301:254-1048(-)
MCRLVSDLSIVRNAHIVLASAACAGRVRIVNDQLGLKARVVHPAAEFAPSPSTAPNDFFVCERARAQAMDVFWRAGAPFHAKHGQVPSLVVGVDTVVRLGDEVLEKPTSISDARAMLQKLSDAGTHHVQTGVALIYGGAESGAPHVHTFLEETSVRFASLSPEQIEAYINTGEPMDEVGAYGIQGLGGTFVTAVQGDFHNAVGFPLARFCDEVDIDRLRGWIDATLPPEVPCMAAIGSTAEDDASFADIPGIECEDDECGLPSD